MAKMSSVPEEQKTDDPDAIIQETDISHSRSPNKRSSRKVVPHVDDDDNNGSEIFVEIKPKRILRVVHLFRTHNVDNGEDTFSELGSTNELMSKKDEDNQWIHQGQNGFKFQTNAQINHNPSNSKEPPRVDTTTKQIDPIDYSPVSTSPKKSQSFKQVSGIDNQGFEDSLADTKNDDSSQTYAKSDSTDNQFSNSSLSQENDQAEPNKTHVFERSVTARNVDIELDDSTSAAEKPSGNDVDTKQNCTSNSQSRKVRMQTHNPSTQSAAVLFFIHGVGGSVDVWKQQLDYFSSKGFEVVCPDLIGHGFSAAPHNPKDYSFEEISVDLLIIFDMFCKKQNVVIGHSYGCSFAAVLARERHSKVNKMILVSGGSPIPLAPQPGIFSLPTCFLACIRPVISRGFIKSAFHSKSHISQEKAFDVPSYVLKYTMNGQWWPEGGAEYHQWIKAATLLIHGAEDKLVLIEEEEEMLETIFGSRIEVIDDASHMVMMEKPEQVNQLIHDFLLQIVPVDSSIKRNSTRTREALKKKPWLRRALSKSKTCAIEPMHKRTDDTLEPSANGGPKTGSKSELKRKGSSLSLKSVKSLPHDLVAGNLY